MISNRVKNIKESGIRKIFDLAAQNNGEYINLSIGQPHFAVQEKLKAAAVRAINENHNGYTPTSGILALKEKIADKLKRENKIDAKADDILISSGASALLMLAMSAILEVGDEIIIPDPSFVSYKQICAFLGAQAVFLDTYPDFHPDIQKLEKLITPKTKAIIINSPNNPTGAVYDKDELGRIAEVSRKHKLIIISDEVYEKFDYENKFFSIGSIYENTITINAFSKSHAITGWRMGYAHAPAEIVQAMSKLQQISFVCAPSFAQFALVEEFEPGLETEYANYKSKRDYLVKSLKEKYEFNIPEGAFYAFIKIPEGRNNFVNELIDNKLLVVPGSAFSDRGDYFRVSFAVSDENLEKGIEVLKMMA